MAIRHDRGIVLRSYPFGEADRVVVLISPDRGKVRAVAKGVRKTTSRIGGRLEHYVHVELVVYEGRSLDTITQVETVEAFPALRSDLASLMVAAVMVEGVDAVVQEGEASVALFDLLADGLRALENISPSPELLPAFLLRLADVVGVRPALDACASCGREDDLDRFSFVGGGVVCSRCGPEGSVRLRDGVVASLAALSGASFRALPAIDPPLSAEATGVVRRFVEHHLDRRLASLGTFES